MLRPTSRSTSKQKLKNNELIPVQTRITVGMIDAMDKLVETGLYGNRSEVVRDGIRRLLYTAKLTRGF